MPPPSEEAVLPVIASSSSVRGTVEWTAPPSVPEPPVNVMPSIVTPAAGLLSSKMSVFPCPLSVVVRAPAPRNVSDLPTSRTVARSYVPAGTSIVSLPAASEITCRSEPDPLSAVLVTFNTLALASGTKISISSAMAPPISPERRIGFPPRLVCVARARASTHSAQEPSGGHPNRPIGDRRCQQPNVACTSCAQTGDGRLRASGRPLLDVHPRDRARDHELLDLGGTLEDVVDLGVAVPALDGELAGVAVAAEDLDRALGDPHGDLAGLELGHRALGVLEGDLVATHPGGAPDEQAGGVDLHLHAREREGDRLVLDDLAAELLALLGVLQRVLVGGARDAEGLRSDRRARGLEGRHRGVGLVLRPLACAGQAFVELLLAAEHVAGGDAAVVEVDVGGGRGAQTVLGDLGALGDALGFAHRHDERGVAFGAELAVDGGDHDVHVGDAAVGGPRLLAVEDPLAGGLVELGAGAHRADVRAGVGLRGAERGDFDVVGGAEAARDPLADLLAGALAEDRGNRERGAHDRHADAGVAPEELFVDDRQAQTGGIGEELREAFEAIEADLGGLLDDRPRGALLLVPLVRGGT